MMSHIIFYVILHFIITGLFLLFDAKIGVGLDDLDAFDPPIELIAFLWEISIPLIIMINIIEFFKISKKKRIKRLESKEKIRIKLLKEEEELMKEVSRELEQDSLKEIRKLK